MSLTNVVGQILHLKSSRFLQNINQNIKFKCLFRNKWENCTNKIFIRRISQENKKQNQEKFVPFLEMVNLRRAEARRSILVQVQSAQSFKELYSYCSTLGTVNQMFHYTAGAELSHFIIVEFAKESHVEDILMNSLHLDDAQSVRVHSNFLWFKASGRQIKLRSAKNMKLEIANGNHIPKQQEIKEILQACESVSDQIMALHNATALNDVATRLRFLTARQVELALSGLFPKAVAYPFGSSVNGFGKMGCDLDVVLRFADEKKPVEESRLVFHCKALNGHERSISQRHMEVIGDLLQLFLPGCAQIRKILNARVPIIKYYHQLTDVECDLSVSNMSGVCMSDLLYLFGAVDPRVRPLVFTIRKWAQEVGLTNSSPGRWISNFSLTLLVLAFLQRPNPSLPILPTFNTFIKNAGSDDRYVTEDGVNCTFLRDISKLNHETKNTDNLESLLKQFCEFYSSFDFSTRAVCLNEAISISKPEHSALYIVNPLERGLNVSKNVSMEELEKFKYELHSAAWILESQEKKNSNWGLLEMFESKKKTFSSSFVIPHRQGRLMQVSRLFETSKEEEGREVLQNESVKEVEQFKKDTDEGIIKDGDSSKRSKRRKSRR